MLAGQAQLWSRDYEASESHLRAAFRVFTDSGEESGLAMVELAEAQRRFFVGKAAQALTLAHRAWLYFERCGFASVAARAAVAKGMAFADLARFDEAAAEYRSSLSVFEREGLWSNYVGAVNSLATALFRAGRLDEARKEFAHALKRLSRPAHLSWVGYLHYGLGDLLLAADRPSDAAQAFGRATARFEESKLLSSALLSRIAEAECRVRGGQRLQSAVSRRRRQAGIGSRPAAGSRHPPAAGAVVGHRKASGIGPCVAARSSLPISRVAFPPSIVHRPPSFPSSHPSITRLSRVRPLLATE